ncbi:MAG: nuclear transport factor 2 family protein [Acidobacteriota bacterium]|nr:nuclear transport factor 2 family protein [Acidobacteriota bacterium]
MKILVALLSTVLFFVNISAQTKTDLQKLIETETAFADATAEKGTKQAFAGFQADDGVVFNPTALRGNLFWSNAKELPALLVWKTSRADVSSTGNFGYTTGGWELRPTGKADKMTAFGQYVTVWKKQTDGNFKVVLDIGVPFDKSAVKQVSDAPKDAGAGEKSPKTKIDMGTLTDIFSKKSLSQGYFNYLAEDAIVLRDNYQPFYGRKQAFLELEKLDKTFPPDGFLEFQASISPNYGNMMAAWGIYQLKFKDNSLKKWNFLQMWKFRDGKWQIVVDVLTPVKN